MGTMIKNKKPQKFDLLDQKVGKATST